MVSRPDVVCDCGHQLQRPIPRICPNCNREIKRIERRSSRSWLSVLLVLVMFGTLLGLILFLGYYMDR